MLAITRQPTLLVKMPSPAGQALGLSFGAAQLNFSIRPLFQSIRPAPANRIGAPAEWQIVSALAPGAEVNAWDLCHHLVVSGGFGIAAGGVEFAEPDLEQAWIFGTEAGHAMALTSPCDHPEPPDPDLPSEPGDFYWFHDDDHSQLASARGEIAHPQNGRILIAHFDTGYDKTHETLPPNLRHDLEHNFVDGDRPHDASDDSSGLVNNLGHGTGTLSILAGSDLEGVPLGGATFLDVVPIRVANAVVLFKNSAIAEAFDYVHQLSTSPDTRVRVITMSMGGLASQAWAEAVNALYEMGVFIVTAAGNNFGNLPTHHIVFPARFKRVVAACGVMENGQPYADLALTKMAGNYGPASKMATALAGCTPNTPWARFGCSHIVNHNGCGTSAATPQIAASAALWIQKYRDTLDAYPEGWMRVEATRKALFDSARLNSADLAARLGKGMVQASKALGITPAAADQLRGSKQPEDDTSFEFLRILTGLGAAAPDSKQRMLELEALQLTQRSHELERLLPDPDAVANIPAEDRRRFVDALIAQPGVSKALRDFLAPHGSGVQGAAVGTAVQVPAIDNKRLQRAMKPPPRTPAKRALRVFAFDPLLAQRPSMQALNETVLEIAWEDLSPGPIGEYLQVVDVDPSTGACYAPVDLNQTFPLSQSGLSPSEANPQFHQQMVYAVAMTTIAHFERALGRVALWSPRRVPVAAGPQRKFVRRLRIYPHALREANAYYSPEKKALLFGYFSASDSQSGETLPGGTVFCCLSHDIVAHETTHALLDGLHPYFQEFTNSDVPAFHEAFADIVALFQHFTIPEALHDAIAATQGDLSKSNLLADLAQQFGEAMGRQKALRSAIADPKQVYDPNAEAHDLGAVLVAAVFDAFLTIYRARGADLIRLATGGTGVLPPGDIPNDLTNRLAREASKTAGQVLNMCIRALDYCPPVDITFGEYLRALITADRDVLPDDTRSYRAAFIDAFRRRAIYPQGVRNLSSESLCWESPDLVWNLVPVLGEMTMTWDLAANRQRAFISSGENRRALNLWIKQQSETDIGSLGFYGPETTSITLNGVQGALSPFEVHSVRPVRRVGPDGQVHLNAVVEITQKWMPTGDQRRYRGGCTLIVDLSTGHIKYCVRKRVAHTDRIAAQQGFQAAGDAGSLRQNYYDTQSGVREPFALLHRGA